jgi:hypothetical protein
LENHGWHFDLLLGLHNFLVGVIIVEAHPLVVLCAHLRPLLVLDGSLGFELLFLSHDVLEFAGSLSNGNSLLSGWHISKHL